MNSAVCKICKESSFLGVSGYCSNCFTSNNILPSESRNYNMMCKNCCSSDASVLLSKDRLCALCTQLQKPMAKCKKCFQCDEFVNCTYTELCHTCYRDFCDEIKEMKIMDSYKLTEEKKQKEENIKNIMKNFGYNL